MRREKLVTVTRAGRDEAKTFVVTEMSAVQAEEWFCRAVMLLARSGTEVPPDIFHHGSAAFAAIGISAALSGLGKAPWAEVKALMVELLACVAFRTPAGPVITVSSQVMSQIEEVETILLLKEEVLSLHLGFSLAAKLLDLRTKAMAAVDRMAMPNTSMSDPSSGSSSAPA
jgi:hypothetical protein